MTSRKNFSFRLASRKPSTLAAIAAFLAVPATLLAQAAPAKEPDVLVTRNGERLVGHLVRSNGSSLVFHSDTVGDVNVDWAKVAQLTSSQRFVVIPKGFTLKRNEKGEQLVRGTISATNQRIQVDPGSGEPQKTVAVDDAGHLIDEPAFNKALDGHGFLQAWKGAFTAGAAFVEATQNSRSFSSTIHLVRAVPTEDWLAPRDRTLVDFSAAYGTLSSPSSPTVKTAIYHLGLEQDRYFSSRMYGFGQAAFDHNFSQGLDLQQTYSGGIGWTVVKTDKQTLDLKASISYISQSFAPPGSNQNLIGSVLNETYQRKLPRGMLFDQQITIVPAWNNTSAYSATGSAGLTVPMYKRLSFSLNTLDTFLNDPPPGFKKNSFQFTMGLTYSLP